MSNIAPVTTRLNINGQWLEYEDEGDNILNYEPISDEDAAETLHKTKELLDEAGIKFSLAFGSLLGAVRDNGHVAKGDKDVDLLIWEEDKLRNNLIDFYSKGLKVTRIYPGRQYSLRVNMNSFIDIYIMRELEGILNLPWRFYCSQLAWWEVPKKFFARWSKITFLGEECMCPENPERLLEFWYGSDWRIPQDKKGTYHVKAFQVYWKYIEKCNRYLKLLSKCFKFFYDTEYRKKILKRKRDTGSYFYQQNHH